MNELASWYRLWSNSEWVNEFKNMKTERPYHTSMVQFMVACIMYNHGVETIKSVRKRNVVFFKSHTLLASFCKKQDALSLKFYTYYYYYWIINFVLLLSVVSSLSNGLSWLFCYSMRWFERCVPSLKFT